MKLVSLPETEAARPDQAEGGDGSSTRSEAGARLIFTLLPALVALASLGAAHVRTYGPSHYFLTYSHGFLKRGLVGELLSPLGYLSAHGVLAIELASIAAAVLASYAVFRRMAFGTLQERCLFSLLFSAPALLPHFSYMTGEMDTFLYLCLLAAVFALLAWPSAAGLVLATAACIVGMLVHEAFALMFYPLVLVLAGHLALRQRLRWWIAAAHLLIVGAVFLAILHYGKPGVPAALLEAEARQRTNLVLEPLVFHVLGSSLGEQLRFVWLMYRNNPSLGVAVVLTVTTAIPYFAMLFWMAARSAALSGYPRIVQRLAGLVFLSPLLLCVLGHDAMRWISALCINLSLYLLYVYTSGGQQPLLRRALAAWTRSPLYFALFGYVLALGAFGIYSSRLVASLGSILGK